MNQRTVALCGCLTVITVGFFIAGEGHAQRARPAPAPGASPGSTTKDQEADAARIREVGETFLKAYNSQDAKLLGTLFTEDAEIEDESGEVTRGRANIIERFTRIFAAKQGGKLSVSPQPVRFLGPELAIEQGSATISAGEGQDSETDRYSVIYVKQDGHWLHARIRDESPSEPTAHERLQSLDWMLGEWVNESDDAIVFTTCKWSPDGNFLLRDFDIKIEGKVALRGTQRIGWDALQKQFRTWVFDSEGGFAEGLMSTDGDQWVVKVSGVRSDGQPVSVTNRITPLGKDRLAWEAADRTISGVAVPAIDQFVVVRKPPQPKP